MQCHKKTQANEIQCRIAKQKLCLEAIQHYIIEGNSSIYRFMSLYNDFETYPIEELAQMQQEHIDAMRAENELNPKDFLLVEIHKAEKMMFRINKRLKTLKGE